MMTLRCILYVSLMVAPWHPAERPGQAPLEKQSGQPPLGAASPAAPRSKRALIIAIGAYDQQPTGWKALNAVNDVPLVREALLRHGFAAADIAVLTDRACTKAGIVGAIQSHLIDAAKPGDVVFLHYTGHGQRIVDDNGDEADGFDEALIPIDAPNKYRQKGYRGENHLRDDEFGSLLDRIRRKVGAGGEVIFTVDACHSGSITRGDGLENPAAPAEPTGYIEMPALPGAQAGLAPFVVFSSSSYNQPTSETFGPGKQPVGPLSYAFSRSFAAATPKVTYRHLYAEIKKIMAGTVPKQTPQVEGDLDRPVLGAPGAE